MEPQRTTQYEVGFSQQIGQDIGVEITGYFKDIRNLNSTKIIQSIVAGDRYGLYINKDFANSRGVTVAISKRRSNKVSGNIDYTYSISEGNASDPAAAFYDEQSNIEPEKNMSPSSLASDNAVWIRVPGPPSFSQYHCGSPRPQARS